MEVHLNASLCPKPTVVSSYLVSITTIIVSCSSAKNNFCSCWLYIFFAELVNDFFGDGFALIEVRASVALGT
jgi:hypothetical protein